MYKNKIRNREKKANFPKFNKKQEISRNRDTNARHMDNVSSWRRE